MGDENFDSGRDVPPPVRRTRTGRTSRLERGDEDVVTSAPESVYRTGSSSVTGLADSTVFLLARPERPGPGALHAGVDLFHRALRAAGRAADGACLRPMKLLVAEEVEGCR